jgi:hypothetical protein
MALDSNGWTVPRDATIAPVQTPARFSQPAMIPECTDSGLLPPGIYPATRDEFEERFVVFDRSDRRFRVYDDLRRFLDEAVGSDIVRRIIVAGSYVTSKPEPNDFDCLLVLDPGIVGRELRPFEYNLISRKMARRLFKGDVVPVLDGSHAMDEYLEFFQTTRDGEPMGVVEIVP